jgi:hypothetical protein
MPKRKSFSANKTIVFVIDSKKERKRKEERKPRGIVFDFSL